jgi:hypothetical protein
MGPPGHFAIGFVAKSVEPSTPLWALLLATEAPNLLIFGFEAAGVEYQAVTQINLSQGMQVIRPKLMPWSHGFLMTIIWPLLIAAISFVVFRNRRASVVLGLMVLSHWMLDFIVQPPDLPMLFNGSPAVGLNLWRSGPGFVISKILELVGFSGGVALFLAARKRSTEVEK